MRGLGRRPRGTCLFMPVTVSPARRRPSHSPWRVATVPGKAARARPGGPKRGRGAGDS